MDIPNYWERFGSWGKFDGWIGQKLISIEKYDYADSAFRCENPGEQRQTHGDNDPQEMREVRLSKK